MDRPVQRLPIFRRWGSRICALAFAVFTVFWAAFYYGADESPLLTLFLFGPRWIAALPLIVLVPLAIYSRSRVAMMLVFLVGLGLLGPIAGGRLPVGRLFESDRPSLQKIRVVSWNTGGAQRGAEFRKFIEDLDPTILLCQETSLAEADFPNGWKVVGKGGNRVATRLPIRFDAHKDLESVGAPGRVERYVVETVDGEITLFNLHLPTPRPGIEAAIATRFLDLTELRRITEIRAEASRVARRWIAERSGNMILAGDFNMPVESRIYRQNWVSFRNAFSECGRGWGTTKQTSWFGTRIDHILYSAPWTCRKAWVGPAMGSDHLPLIADLEWTDSVD